MFKAVLFDLDNTLTDFMRMKDHACDAAISAMIDSGMDIGRVRARNVFSGLFEKHGMEDPQIFQKFLKKTSGNIDYRVLANAITAYRKAQTGILCPYPRIRKTLVRLKELGIMLGVVSDAPKLKAWLRLSEMNIADFFDFVVALEDTGKLKPHRLPFEAAIEKSGFAASNILFVGDNPVRDIKGAKNAGMKAALAKYGQVIKGRGIKADYILRNVSDIVKIIEENKKA
jgi:putative hydrolase of the HAD superfamily